MIVFCFTFLCAYDFFSGVFALDSGFCDSPCWVGAGAPPAPSGAPGAGAAPDTKHAQTTNAQDEKTDEADAKKK